MARKLASGLLLSLAAQLVVAQVCAAAALLVEAGTVRGGGLDAMIALPDGQVIFTPRLSVGLATIDALDTDVLVADVAATRFTPYADAPFSLEHLATVLGDDLLLYDHGTDRFVPFGSQTTSLQGVLDTPGSLVVLRGVEGALAGGMLSLAEPDVGGTTTTSTTTTTSDTTTTVAQGSTTTVANTSSTTSSIASGSTTTTTTLPPSCSDSSVADPATCVRRYQCFDLKRGVTPAPPSLTITDEFGQHTAALALPDRLCAPASVDDDDPTAPIAAQHLTSYFVPQKVTVAERGLVVTARFGTVVLDTMQLRHVLAPTTESLTAPPAALVPPTLDHFACYTVRASHGLGVTPRFSVRRGIAVQDEFGRRYVTVVKPATLCFPADANRESSDAASHAVHLLCYRTRSEPPRFPGVAPIFTTDRFGGHIIAATRSAELCVPALVQRPTP